MNKRLSALLLAVAVALSLSVTGFAVEAPAFTDIAGTPYETAILYCQQNGFVKGTSATTFTPNGALNRAQLATIWARTLQFKDENHKFTDITPLQNYYDTPMIIMHSKDIINGTSTTKASPMQPITREQLALITMRTHSLGAASVNAYQMYTDYADISTWAREAISACINAGVFVGLYDSGNFLPAKAVTRGEICKLIYNLNAERYSITIADMTDGDVSSSHDTARAGTRITLDIDPDEGMQLVEGSLKYNDTAITGRTFNMPAENVTITAEFEEIPVVDTITVATMPATVEYEENEMFDTTGLTITVNYTNAEPRIISTGFTTDPVNGDTLTTQGEVTVTVTYETKTTQFTITVSEPSSPLVIE